MSKRILIVDDDPAMGRMLAASLGKRGYEVAVDTEPAAAFERLRTSDVDVLVTDLHMRGASGLELCERAVADRPDVPVIVITAFGSLDAAIGAIRAGAYDFVPKPFEIDVLEVALERALRHRALEQEVRRLRQVVAATGPWPELLGESAPMRRVSALLARLSDSDATVLITGESGTGKELVARALHGQSRRAAGPFVAVNCAAMPESLLEAELFGHERGAFTDARSARSGLFMQAHGGTLFLDEIGELPLSLQPKLLRALQERKLRPLGGAAEVAFDARVCTATNRDLETAVEDGRFREDLFYRLDVVRVELPPLRSRGRDILLLAQSFLDKLSTATGPRIHGISPPAAERLLAYRWPGNVRELQNCIERAVALAEYDTLVVEDLPERVRSYRATTLVLPSEDPAELLTMEEVERRYIERVLDAVAGNKTAAAKVLGYDRATLYRKLERWGLDPASKRG